MHVLKNYQYLIDFNNTFVWGHWPASYTISSYVYYPPIWDFFNFRLLPLALAPRFGTLRRAGAQISLRLGCLNASIFNFPIIESLQFLPLEI